MLRAGRFRHRRRNGSRWAVWLLFVLVLLCFAFALFNIKLLPVLRILAANRAKIQAQEIINDSIGTVMKRDAVTYDSLMTFQTNQENQITAIKSNSLAINNLRYDITKEVLKELNHCEKEDLKIPIGDLFGGILFNNMGPAIRVRVYPLGTVTVGYSNLFTSAGINQTHQQVILKVNTRIIIILSYVYSIQENVSDSVCIADTILVGNVPQGYLNVS